MVNLEVVKRSWPYCRDYVDGRDACRSCKLLTHVRGQGGSRTLCGAACTSMDGWMVLPDWHPEDASAVDRCELCYEALERMKAVDGEAAAPVW